MASLAELYELKSNSELRNRIEMACLIEAETIRVEENPTAARTAWSRAVFADPTRETGRMFRALIAAHAESPIDEIENVGDTPIKTAVAAAVDHFAAE